MKIALIGDKMLFVLLWDEEWIFSEQIFKDYYKNGPKLLYILSRYLNELFIAPFLLLICVTKFQGFP